MQAGISPARSRSETVLLFGHFETPHTYRHYGWPHSSILLLLILSFILITLISIKRLFILPTLAGTRFNNSSTSSALRMHLKNCEPRVTVITGAQPVSCVSLKSVEFAHHSVAWAVLKLVMQTLFFLYAGRSHRHNPDGSEALLYSGK